MMVHSNWFYFSVHFIVGFCNSVCVCVFDAMHKQNRVIALGRDSWLERRMRVSPVSGPVSMLDDVCKL